MSYRRVTVPGMDESPGLIPVREYRVAVNLKVAPGADGTDVAGFLGGLDRMGVRLDVAGTPVSCVALKVTVTVIVRAGGPVTALIAGADKVAAAAPAGLTVTGSRLVPDAHAALAGGLQSANPRISDIGY
jgi:hypothetical protein